ncbi:MAG: alpha/beta fold hydrolase [Microbacteriaceae bacterium]|nr:alpha/beta fold hydrolase [Burkholderiaceae bacterium]
MTAVLRTPDQRFAGLPGWGYAPQYCQPLGDDGPRMAYVDEGPRDAAITVLCLHGNPTWGYLYRHMLPVFIAAGLRVVVPDLIGFGRSDKPAGEAWHTFERHRQSLLRFIETLDLQNVMLVCQDWGGIFGLTLPMAMPTRFTRLLVMNTTLATGELTEGFRAWRDYSNRQPDLAVGKLLRRGKPAMTEAEAAAYDAPFPDATYKAALRAFPNLVPEGADAPGAATSRDAQAFWQHRWAGDSLMAVGLQDPVLGGPTMAALRELIRGCPPAMQVAEAGHFVPEWGAPIAQAALAHFGLAPP